MEALAMRIVLTSESDIVVVLESVDGIDLSANVELLCGVIEISDRWVLWVAAKDILGLLFS
jgi:hypothetical protein